jgi:hypothetical protein
VHVLRTFFSHRIQLLQWQKTKMWLYLGPCCPDCPSSEELSVAEVDTWIHKVLDLSVNPNLEVGPAPLQGGVASARVSMLGPILVVFMILSFH